MILLLISKVLSKNFEMKDLGDASFVIDIQIQRDRTRGILGLSQKIYINKVLDRYGMKNCFRRDKLSLLQCPKNDLWKSKWKIFHMHRQLKVWCMLKFVPIRHSIYRWETWQKLDQSWDWSLEDYQEGNAISMKDYKKSDQLQQIRYRFRLCWMYQQ